MAVLRGCVLAVQPEELLRPRLGERGCWCGDAVEFVAIFWDVLASWILDAEIAAAAVCGHVSAVSPGRCLVLPGAGVRLGAGP